MDKNKTEKTGYEHFSISNTLWSRQTLSREWGRWFKVQALCTDLEGKVEGNLNISNLPSKITENIPRNPPCKLKHPLEPPPLPEQNSGCVPEQTYETPSYHCRNFLRYLILCSKTIMTNTDITSAVFQTLQCPVFLHVSTVFAFFYQEVDNEMEFKP